MEIILIIYYFQGEIIMAVWGMGSFFNGTDNQFDNFISGKFVCMLWKENDVP